MDGWTAKLAIEECSYRIKAIEHRGKKKIKGV